MCEDQSQDTIVEIEHYDRYRRSLIKYLINLEDETASCFKFKGEYYAIIDEFIEYNSKFYPVVSILKDSFKKKAFKQA